LCRHHAARESRRRCRAARDAAWDLVLGSSGASEAAAGRAPRESSANGFRSLPRLSAPGEVSRLELSGGRATVRPLLGSYDIGAGAVCNKGTVKVTSLEVWNRRDPASLVARSGERTRACRANPRLERRFRAGRKSLVGPCSHPRSNRITQVETEPPCPAVGRSRRSSAKGGACSGSRSSQQHFSPSSPPCVQLRAHHTPAAAR